MDLVAGARRCIVLMSHTIKGKPKLLKECSLPLTGVNVVDQIITDLGVFDVGDNQLVLREIAEGVEVEEVREKTEANLEVADDLKTVSLT